MTATVEGIFRSPSASQPMEPLQAGTLIAGKGLDGDRYCLQQGTYSLFCSSKNEPGTKEPGRQLTMVSADSLEAAFDRHSLPRLKSWGDLRRNIVLRGVTAETLLGSTGQMVQLGPECKVLIHRHTVPCMYNERKNATPGMMEAIWMESGVSCEVVVGGTFAVGDAVKILTETGVIDDGIQPPGYYVPPSKRSAAMVKGSIDFARSKKKEFDVTDPEGVDRARLSYESVGLTFWPRDKE